MPSTNARGHVIPSASDLSISRATIFQEFGESIRDVVPVANTTARTTLVSALTAAGETPSSTKPLYVYRQDAPGLHRIEYTADGTNWVTVSGLQFFASTSARDSWTTTNVALLSVGDECFVSNVIYSWSGSTWLPNLMTSWTPSWENLSIGSGGSNWGEYGYTDGRCRGEAKVILGTTGFGFSANPVRLTPPITPRSTVQDNVPVGQVTILDNGTGWAAGWLMMTNLGMLELRTYGSPLSNGVNGSNPINFAASDQIVVRFDYRA